MILDLETLKHVKFSFELHSDHSTMCNGYRSLCRMIEEVECKVNENFAQPAVIGSVCTCTNFRETPMINGKHICSICNKPIVQTDL